MLQASIEFEVADAEAASAAGEELQATGYQLLHPACEEPWARRPRGVPATLTREAAG